VHRAKVLPKYSNEIADRRIRPCFKEPAMTPFDRANELLTASGLLARRDENQCVAELRRELAPLAASIGAVEQQSRDWIETLRANGPRRLGLEALLLEYRLDTPEGIALMCLAEALLRIPDADTADRLIHDVLSPLSWQDHLGHSEDFFVNAASWGLALTGRLLQSHEQPQGQPQRWIERIAGRIGEKLLRQALQQTMRFLANQFVLGETLPAALHRAEADWRRGYTHSFDMLGEAALTYDDSRRYFAAYRVAIETVGACASPPAVPRPSISIKLSALHPRYTTAQWPLLQHELVPALCELCEFAATHNVALSIDAEENDRLELSLQLLAAVFAQLPPSARACLGVVVQAYNKRALGVLQYLRELTTQFSIRMNVRLVKGAYWDSEIKRAQQRGLESYPVFTRKYATDLSYLACAQYLLQHLDNFYPQFATHNATTIAAIIALAKNHDDFELQRLHGMGEALYDCVRAQHADVRCRIYAPIGEHRELLPYLVRRLLENGANTSFIHQLYDRSVAPEALAIHPLNHNDSESLPLPPSMFAPERANSPGFDWHNRSQREIFLAEIARHQHTVTETFAAIDGVSVRNPATQQIIGYWPAATTSSVAQAVAVARRTQPRWENLGVEMRAAYIERAADLMIEHRAELIALMAMETGKTLENALDEVREAVDYCRYYAAQARKTLHAPLQLPGPTGENNVLLLRPRGLFACISPWNFPLAIFCGQIIAALITGNTVVAKPAEQSTLTALRAAELFYRAGIPREALHILPGNGETIGAALCGNRDVDGVVFTGSFDTAKIIQRQLAERDGAIVPFIAETAGLNCMIADSSAQPQQLTIDVLRSAFDSAGQRCSALRILFLPTSNAAAIEALLVGAIETMQVGDPLDWRTDIGPIIDTDARQKLIKHLETFEERGQLLFRKHSPSPGTFLGPALVRLQAIGELTEEAFGPILHIIHYDENAIEQLADTINATQFGLTCGIHSRNVDRAQNLASRLRVGNCYINRDMIGAVVGVQPFGGRGKSGTGPKAGGPHYLLHFLSEQTITTNTAALGGDPQLLSSTAH
jgi:RHH-type proline utilization regulon transcriptional repressor/proline dehydrogenase/delta 1-pyrroline-5-carboxylate dehydrogenase